MAEPQGAPKAAASPAKLVLAIVLTIVFITVLFVQFGGMADGREASGEAAAKASFGEITRRAADRRKPPTRPEVEPAAPSAPQWPSAQLEDALGHDPFATPAAFRLSEGVAVGKSARESAEEARIREEERRRRQAERDRSLQALREQGVQVVMGAGGSGGVAVIGTCVVHVGDELGGFRVTDIQPDGVVLEQTPVD